MSQFVDFCECICRQLQRNLETVQQILTRANGQDVTTTGSAIDFGIRQPNNEGLSISTILTITFVILFLMMILQMRGRREPSAINEKPTPQTHGERRSEGDC